MGRRLEYSNTRNSCRKFEMHFQSSLGQWDEKFERFTGNRGEKYKKIRLFDSTYLLNAGHITINWASRVSRGTTSNKNHLLKFHTTPPTFLSHRCRHPSCRKLDKKSTAKLVSMLFVNKGKYGTRLFTSRPFGWLHPQTIPFTHLSCSNAPAAVGLCFAFLCVNFRINPLPCSETRALSIGSFGGPNSQ